MFINYINNDINYINNNNNYRHELYRKILSICTCIKYMLFNGKRNKNRVERHG